MKYTILSYLILINVLTFIAFAIDKWKAINHRWRIRENYLLILCVFGGLPGGWLAMFLIRHKIKDVSFLAKISCISIIWIIGIIVFLRK